MIPAVPPRVFISHASADAALAFTICDGLESRGVRCWIALATSSPMGRTAPDPERAARVRSLSDCRQRCRGRVAASGTRGRTGQPLQEAHHPAGARTKRIGSEARATSLAGSAFPCASVPPRTSSTLLPTLSVVRPSSMHRLLNHGRRVATGFSRRSPRASPSPSASSTSSPHRRGVCRPRVPRIPRCSRSPCLPKSPSLPSRTLRNPMWGY